MTGKIVAVCTSEKKGTQKYEVPEGNLVPGWGIEGDAHAGKWHRQVSLLALERIEAFREKWGDAAYGAFGENLVVSGVDLRSIPVGTKVRVGGALLKVSQIGKQCHTDCEIARRTGECLMPKEGIFAEVLEGGVVRPGDAAEFLPLENDRPFTAAVITLSDRAFNGNYKDQSGPLMADILRNNGFEVVEYVLLPDEKRLLKQELIRLADYRQVNVIFTTGGTGFSERDITPEATLEVCDRHAPGIAEAMRWYSLQITPKAMLSRQASGIRKGTLIVNMPGSPKAVREDLDFILKPLEHGLGILRGTDTN